MVNDALLQLWPELLAPLAQALTAHCSLRQLQQLRMLAAERADTPPSILRAIDGFILVRQAAEETEHGSLD